MASSSTAPEPQDGFLQPPLLRLPLEIVNLIADRYLSPRDCKSLRLTCHFFEASMIRPLFQRVFLSKTELDRNNFFNIAQSPRLAAAARELIWYELAEDETVFFAIEEDAAGEIPPKGKEPVVIRASDDDPAALSVCDSASADHQDCDDNTPKLPPLSTIARNAFWWTSLGSSQEYRRKKPEKYIEKLEQSRTSRLEDFLPRFYSALDAMPNIRTFVSCPMPSLRTVCKDVYPLTAQLFQRGVGLGWGPYHTNDGFFYFLLPAMRRAGSKIERLAYADEGLTSSLCSLRPSDIFAFRMLKHVDLCLGWVDDESMDDIGICLRAAPGLVDLGICMERSNRGFTCGRSNWSNRQSALECLFGTGERQLWPHLRRLKLTDIRTSRSDSWPSQGDPLKALTRLLTAHASTLRDLSFHQCEVTRVLIEAVAKVPGLALESLQVNNKSSLDAPIVPVSELLAYVNGKGPCPVNVGDNSAWNTETMILDPHLMPTAALFEASTTGQTLYSKEHIATIFDCLHPDDRHILGSHHSLYTRKKSAKLKLANNNHTAVRGAATGGSYLTFVETEGLPISKWLFKHPDGQEAVGDEPLEFFSDWEDSCDESSADEDEDMQDAPRDGPTDKDGNAADPGTIDGDEDDDDDDDDDEDSSSWDDSDGSVFEGDELITRLEAPVTMLEKRYRAIPLFDLETQRQ